MVEGAAIETVSWGDPGRQSVLLVHGSMAHAHWWQPTAQLLSFDYHVTSISFSGMGGSDHRESYSVRQMAREIVGVADALALFEDGRRPVLAAHSFGGKPASFVAGQHGAKFAGLIFADSFIVPTMMGGAPPYRPRFYGSEAEALSRFRLSPDEPGGEPFVLDAIARAGVVERDGKWTWRFDPNFFTKLHFENGWDEVKKSQCPLAFLRGEYSEVATREDFALQHEHLRPDSLFVEIPDAWHHIMVHQPLALTTAMRAIIEGWAVRRA